MFCPLYYIIFTKACLPTGLAFKDVFSTRGDWFSVFVMATRSCVYLGLWVGHRQAHQQSCSSAPMWVRGGRGQARQRSLCVVMESGCQVSQPIGRREPFKDRRTLACPSIWGELTVSDSPDVELLGKLRSSSATQEKLQYPLGMPAAVLPPNSSPAETVNPHFSFLSKWKTDIKL